MFTFIREVQAELLKVSYPTRQEAIRLTVLVIVISVIVGAYLGGLDYIFAGLLQMLLS
jgi:preprotein translocase subunit SecE